jgi:hypothetical protein
MPVSTTREIVGTIEDYNMAMVDYNGVVEFLINDVNVVVDVEGGIFSLTLTPTIKGSLIVMSISPGLRNVYKVIEVA